MQRADRPTCARSNLPACNAAPEPRSRSAGGWTGRTSATGSAAPCVRPPDTARWPTARSTTARACGRLSCAVQDREPSGTIPCCRPPQQSAPVPPRRRWRSASELLVVPKSMPMAEGMFLPGLHTLLFHPAPAERPPSARGRSGGRCRVPYCAAGAAAIAAYPTARPERRPLPRTLRAAERRPLPRTLLRAGIRPRPLLEAQSAKFQIRLRLVPLAGNVLHGQPQNARLSRPQRRQRQIARFVLAAQRMRNQRAQRQASRSARPVPGYRERPPVPRRPPPCAARYSSP